MKDQKLGAFKTIDKPRHNKVMHDGPSAEEGVIVCLHIFGFTAVLLLFMFYRA